MKKIIVLAITALLCINLCSCGGGGNPQPTDPPVPTQIPYADRSEITDADAVLTRLTDGNLNYMRNYANTANITKETRIPLAEEGSNPYALVITCADSTTVPEYIFDAGLGDLIVLRTFGNVVDDTERAAIEYAIKNKNIKLVVVLGHLYCDAISMVTDEREGAYTGYAQMLKERMETFILEDAEEAKYRPVEEDEYDHYDRLCTELNITQSMVEIRYDEALADVIVDNGVRVVGGIYNTASGRVDFLWDSER